MPTPEQKNIIENASSIQSSSPEEKVEDMESIIDDIESLPTDAKKLVKVVQEVGLMGVGHISQENEIAKKINAEHITNYLDGAKEQMQNAYKERHEKKIYTVILVVLALIFFVTVIVLLQDKPEILEKVIYSVAALVAGAFGGYGFGKQSSQSDD